MRHCMEVWLIGITFTLYTRNTQKLYANKYSQALILSGRLFMKFNLFVSLSM